MPKAAADIISTPIAISTATSDKPDSHPLVTIALFSGIGLLVSLIAILTGVPGEWF
jgi:hypothetical protein